MATVFLYAPQDFRNLCANARTLEVLGHREAFVFDPWRLIRDSYGKSRRREMRDVSSGAFSRIEWRRVDDPQAFLPGRSERVVATVADASAPSLTEFAFRSDDLLLFGGESQGLPEDVVSLAGARVTIPNLGQTQSLNVSVALAIVVFEAHRQLKAAPPSSATPKESS